MGNWNYITVWTGSPTGCQHRSSGESKLLPLSGSNEIVLSLFLSEQNHQKPIKTQRLSNIQSFTIQYKNGQVSIKKSLVILRTKKTLN